jgi:hypothetical protein
MIRVFLTCTPAAEVKNDYAAKPLHQPYSSYVFSTSTWENVCELVSAEKLISAAEELYDATDGHVFFQECKEIIVALRWKDDRDIRIVMGEPRATAPATHPIAAAPGTIGYPHPAQLGSSPLSASAAMPTPTLRPEPALRRTEEPGPAPEGSARRRLAEALKLAWRRAGEPPMRSLERMFLAKGVNGAISPASISKALSGSTGRPPSWVLVENLLRQFNITDTDIDGFWRELWVQAREEVSPLGATVIEPVNMLTPARAADGSELVVTPDKASTRISALPETGPAAARSVDGTLEPHVREAPTGYECEDCGSWVVNADRHHAWHWTVERQLRRASIRSVENTG